MPETYEAAVASGKSTQDRRSDTLVLAGVTGGHAISHFAYQSFLVMLPAVRDALALSAVQVGAIATIREMASGLASLPGGIICDRYRRSWGLVLALCMAGFGLGWLTVGLSHTYLLLAVGMATTSVAASIWHLPAMAALSQRFVQRRGTALSIHGVGGSVGDVLGPLLTGFLLGYMAWRGVLSLYSIGPFLLAVLVLRAFGGLHREGAGEDVGGDLRAQMRDTRELLRSRTLWRVNLVSALHGMSYQVYTTFLPLYLADELGFDARAIGLYIGMLFAVGIVVSPAMGYLSDHLGRKKVLVPTLIGSCLFSLLLALAGRGVWLAVIIALLGIFLRSDFSLLSAAALDIVGHRVATTTLGVLSFTKFVLGAASPLIGGLLYQSFGMAAALYYVAGLFALATVVLMTTRLAPTTAR